MRWARALALVLGVGGGGGVLGAPGAAPSGTSTEPARVLGYAVTRGAAPGYLDDRACATCHQEIATSFSSLGMGRSFYRPFEQPVVESPEPFLHAPSGRWYRMEIQEGSYRFHRHELDDEGKPIHAVEFPVAWILGSGNHARTYLAATPEGQLIQLPLAWYGQTRRWGMAPGFDGPRHIGVQRMVRRSCMACHNGYPDVPAGSDSHESPHTFPTELPHGIGCQRCHGPGAAHAAKMVAADMSGDPGIVDPATLVPRRRNDVCYQCHMQPSVSIFGVRRYGRGAYAFEPGQALADHRPILDVVEDGVARRDRFEINHHPYRLEQSRCFTESDGALSCLSCHDPHRKAPAAERAAHVRSRCLSCHDLAGSAAHPGIAPGECTSCHMPTRRTRDVVQVTMTDHLIQRPPADREALVRPRTERDPVLVGAHFLYPDRAPSGDLGEIYRVESVLRAGSTEPSALAYLETLLARTGLPDLTPRLQLATVELTTGRLAKAGAGLRSLLESFPEQPLVLARLGMVHALEGKLEEGIGLMRRALAADPTRAETSYNLGLFLISSGNHREAREHLERAVTLRPTMSLGWLKLGTAHEALGEPEAALAAYRRSLDMDPFQDRTTVALATLLAARGEVREARRYLRHGLAKAPDPTRLREVLARLDRDHPDGR